MSWIIYVNITNSLIEQNARQYLGWTSHQHLKDEIV